MKRFTIALASLAITAALPALVMPAYAQSAADVLPKSSDDIEKYRTFKKWAIMQNNTRGHCLGTKSDESGVLQIGMTADESMGYVGVFVKEDVAAGASNAVAIEVGGQTYTGETSGPVGNLGGGWHGGYVLSNNKDFRRALEKNDTMTAFPDQPFAVKLNIEGANNAIYEILKCSREMPK